MWNSSRPGQVMKTVSRRFAHIFAIFGNSRLRSLGLIVTVAVAPTAQAAAETAPLVIAAAADGDYVHFGADFADQPQNAGDIANLGVIVGSSEVAVVDTGGSVQVGRRLIAAVRSVTDKPIRYVINTHEHPDHIFGNAAFGAGVTFVGHHNLPAELAKRAPYYLRSFRDVLGAEAIAEVRIVPPSRLVEDETVLDLGDRSIRLTARNPAAHTDCDLTVLDEKTGVLFAGDLVFLQHVPVLDGSLRGWLSILPKLAELPAKIVVPGHGGAVAASPEALQDERRYLDTLAADSRRLIAAGEPIRTAIPQIGRSERGRWQLFDDYNSRNATAAFGELEWE